jgi:hypothetical protein
VPNKREDLVSKLSRGRTSLFSCCGIKILGYGLSCEGSPPLMGGGSISRGISDNLNIILSLQDIVIPLEIALVVIIPSF